MLVLGLRPALSMYVENLKALSNSKLVVSQVNGSYEMKDGRMASYLFVVKELTVKFRTFKMAQILIG